MNTADTIAGEIADLKDEFGMLGDWTERYPVSYTHLTLPTIYSV